MCAPMYGHARLPGSWWWVWSGGSKQKGPPAKLDYLERYTFCQLLENVQHIPQIHDLILTDVLSDGVDQTDDTNTPAPISRLGYVD